MDTNKIFIDINNPQYSEIEVNKCSDKKEEKYIKGNNFYIRKSDHSCLDLHEGIVANLFFDDCAYHHLSFIGKTEYKSFIKKATDIIEDFLDKKCEVNFFINTYTDFIDYDFLKYSYYNEEKFHIYHYGISRPFININYFEPRIQEFTEIDNKENKENPIYHSAKYYDCLWFNDFSSEIKKFKEEKILFVMNSSFYNYLTIFDFLSLGNLGMTSLVVTNEIDLKKIDANEFDRIILMTEYASALFDESCFINLIEQHSNGNLKPKKIDVFSLIYDLHQLYFTEDISLIEKRKNVFDKMEKLGITYHIPDIGSTNLNTDIKSPIPNFNIVDFIPSKLELFPTTFVQTMTSK